MCECVILEIGETHEALGTDVAGMRPLAGVQQDVFLEVCHAPEALATCGTRVWPLPAVHERVYLQIAVLSEALPTLPAHVGFLPGVDAIVYCQIEVVTKTFLTYVTDVKSIRRLAIRAIPQNWLEVGVLRHLSPETLAWVIAWQTKQIFSYIRG